MLHVRQCVSIFPCLACKPVPKAQKHLPPVTAQLPLVLTDVVHPGSETILLDEGMPLPAEEQAGAHQPATGEEPRGNMVVIFKVPERQKLLYPYIKAGLGLGLRPKATRLRTSNPERMVG